VGCALCYRDPGSSIAPERAGCCRMMARWFPTRRSFIFFAVRSGGLGGFRWLVGGRGGGGVGWFRS